MGTHASNRRSVRRGLTGAAIGLGWFGAIGLAAMVGVPMLYVVWLCCCTALTTGVYAYDKLMARRGGWRVPERTLHLLTFAGGAAGALFAMIVLRHKTRHRGFWMGAVAALTLHSTALVMQVAHQLTR